MNIKIDQKDKNNTVSVHRSVLLNEAVDGLNLKEGDVFFDGTLGGGGHSEKVCSEYGNKIKLIAVDRDAEAIERAKNKLERFDCEKHFVLSNYKNIDKVIESLKILKVDKILLDLGLSSDQFETSGRGFAFRTDEPLFMTFSSDPENEVVNAEKIVNDWSEETIADILFGYADEKYARRIARVIVEERQIQPIKTTFELVAIVEKAVPAIYKRGKIHFATKTFQALRIAVNDEIESLKEGLIKSFECLNSEGRISVISFHSIEDRIVKNFFKEKSLQGLAKVITKKPIVPTDEEIRSNPRSRSAKLRILEKI
jgi:16S rRNA (cytosine1402-N4)-methyltransferase